MKISKSAVTKICQWLENKGLPVLADELYSGEVRTEFRYLLSLQVSDRDRFIFPSERITIYKNGESQPSVLWHLNHQWKKNLKSYEDLGKVDERVVSSNFQQFIS